MSQYFAMVLAAGSGERFKADRPKLYQLIHQKPLLWYTLHAFFQLPMISKVAVVIAPDDVWFEQFEWIEDSRFIVLKVGGSSRFESVKQGFHAFRNLTAIDPQDWLLTHDGARCCIAPHDISNLIAQLGDDSVGGLLARPISDTIKQTNNAYDINKTLDRDGLWLAQTPQMFRVKLLQEAINQKGDFTDEASAVEALGYQPKLIKGSAKNIKVTYPDDLDFAQICLTPTGVREVNQ